MQFGKASGGSGAKQSPVLMIVLVVVILAAGFMVVRNMMGSGGGSETTSAPVDMSGQPGQPGAPPPPGGVGAPPGQPPAPVMGETGGQPPPPAPPAPMGEPVAGAAPPGQSPTPSAAAPAPSQAPTGAPTDVKPGPTRQIKVFGSVSITYPSSWKISAGGGNLSAIFTDGKGVFEVHPPDPKATTAKAMAESGVKTLARGSTVTAQGSTRIGGHDSYWIAVTRGGATSRIVGVDGPTRVILYEHVKGAPFSAYRERFDKIQAGIMFGG